MAGELTNILTESGTNEVEVLVFQLADGHYGVNVAKVREIIEPVPVARIAKSHPAVRGLFQLRGTVLPLVDLRFFFQMPPAENEETPRVIVMEFNDERLGFLVDHVDRIHRTSWKAMSESPWCSPEGEQAITSVLRLDEILVLMLDFERVAFKIAGIERLQDAVPQTSDLDRGNVSILLADDSTFMRRMLGRSLADAGFSSVEFANDGQEAWDRLDERVTSGQLPDIVVTDLEMPRMDGLHLTKRIKTDPRLNGLPVIVFSSRSATTTSRNANPSGRIVSSANRNCLTSFRRSTPCCRPRRPRFNLAGHASRHSIGFACGTSPALVRED